MELLNICIKFQNIKIQDETVDINNNDKEEDILSNEEINVENNKVQ